jgi:hypothetical protein
MQDLVSYKGEVKTLEQVRTYVHTAELKEEYIVND